MALDGLYDFEDDQSSTTHLDGLGNTVDNATGNLISVVSGSQGDLGTKGVPAVPTVPSTPSTPSLPSVPTLFASAASAYNNAIQTIGNVADNAQKKIFGVDVEDIVFIGIGLLLLAAGVFAFKTSQTVIQVATNTATKVGKRATEVAAA